MEGLTVWVRAKGARWAFWDTGAANADSPYAGAAVTSKVKAACSASPDFLVRVCAGSTRILEVGRTRKNNTRAVKVYVSTEVAKVVQASLVGGT